MGSTFKVGTPLALPLRMEHQELVPGTAPPALIEAWDIWLMLTRAVGYEVKGDRLVVDTRFLRRAVIESSGPQHGNAQALTPEKQNNLLTFLITLRMRKQ